MKKYLAIIGAVIAGGIGIAFSAAPAVHAGVALN